MSWQSYVDDHLVAVQSNGGRLTHAAIAGKDGTVWAKDEAFEITTEEVLRLASYFVESSEVHRTGIILNGEKYIAVVIDIRPGECSGSLICGKQGSMGGVVISRTHSALVVGVHKSLSESFRLEHCNLIVTHISKFLIDQGY